MLEDGLQVTLTGALVAQWLCAGLQVNRLSNQSCTWGMILAKLDLDSPGCCFNLTLLNCSLKCYSFTYYLEYV